MKKKLFFLFTVLLFFIQCSEDDNDSPTYTARDYSEQVLVDQDLLENYLKTHTYNYEDFNNESDVDIKLDTITDDSSRLSLFEQAKIKTVDIEMLTVKLYLTIYIILLPEKVLTVNLQSSTLFMLLMMEN